MLWDGKTRAARCGPGGKEDPAMLMVTKTFFRTHLTKEKIWRNVANLSIPCNTPGPGEIWGMWETCHPIFVRFRSETLISVVSMYLPRPQSFQLDSSFRDVKLFASAFRPFSNVYTHVGWEKLHGNMAITATTAAAAATKETSFTVSATTITATIAAAIPAVGYCGRGN